MGASHTFKRRQKKVHTVRAMRRISSRMTFYNKRVFPIIWFGFLLLFIAVPLLTNGGKALPPMLFVVPAVMGIFGYFMMKKLVFDLVDEVLDDGDTLIVRNRGMEDRIALTDIVNVSYSQFINPPRVTLLLRRPSQFGTQISFGAPIKLIPFSPSPIIDDLIQRIEAKRSKP
jgi:hypothetical protein